MDRVQIADAINAVPFTPFTIHISDGDLVPVLSREFFWLPPEGDTVFIALWREGSFHTRIIAMSHISQLTIGPVESVHLPSSPR
jgi:hypothetical protein